MTEEEVEVVIPAAPSPTSMHLAGAGQAWTVRLEDDDGNVIVIGTFKVTGPVTLTLSATAGV